MTQRPVPARGVTRHRIDTPQPAPLLTPDDLHLFNEGTHLRLYDRLGCHLEPGGAHLAVWAPNARQVSVVGDWNGWDEGIDRLAPQGGSGIWHGFVPSVAKGDHYKFRIWPRHGFPLDKADPFGFLHECPPRTASRAWDLAYQWGDASWMRTRAERNRLDAPMSVYEVHLGSWRRVPEEGNRSLTYREAAPILAEHANELGFTHVELLPIMEHPFFGSWGYQTTGYFAPTARQGTPQDFMHLVDTLHRAGIGVILDWVPSHFPNDAHGLAWFDGTHLFEHADPRQGFHPDWASCIFNYGRHEVRSFLLSSAMFWLDKYHIDSLRVDAVASMLYLDYSRKAGEWVPNPHGGNENLDAIAFMRRLNESAYLHHPGIQTIAEESTAWPAVSRPTWLGGLGFGLKWDMGWMHDTLRYLARDPIHRKHHQGEISFRALYAFHENFLLPLSHDEVVHGKGSLVGKMPGDEWSRFANLRLLHAYQHATPAKKLLFMGGEFGQVGEWHHDSSLDWHVLQYPVHAGAMRLVGDLNRLHRREPALHELDCDPAGFEWVDASDADNSVYAFLRKARDPSQAILCVANFTPTPRMRYRVGVPHGGAWRELMNTDAKDYAGSGMGNGGRVHAEQVPWHGRPWSVVLTLPPLAMLMLKAE